MLPRKIYSLFQKVEEYRPHGKPVSEVLMFHEVYNTKNDPWNPSCAISTDCFLALLDALTTEHVVTPEQLHQQGSVLLTFDDIFASAYRNAFPALRERNLPYTVFIAPGLLGTDNYITMEDLQELAKDSLCTIGAHTMHHDMLRFQTNMVVSKEMCDSKAYLEDILGREVENFAFPYGSIYACSSANIAQVAACGFQRGFSTLNRRITEKDLAAPWFLPRRNVNDAFLRRSIY